MRPVLLLAVLVLPVLADEMGDLERQAKDKEYGAYWDRTKAFGKLAKIGSVKAAQAVLPHCGDEEPAVREFAALAVADFEAADAIAWLAANAPSLKAPEGRASAFWGFGVSGREAYMPVLEKAAATDRDPVARAAALRALAMFGSKVKVNPFLAGLKDAAWQVKEEAAFAAAELRAPEAADALAKLLADPAWQPHAAALYGLASCAPEKLREALPKSSKHKSYQVRLACVEAAFQAAPDDGFNAALAGLDDEAWQVRVASVGVFLQVWEERVIEPLILRLEKEKGRLRYDIALALRQLTGKEIGWKGVDWRLWWEANKAEFKIGKKPKERGGAVKGDGSEASFYDIPILSDRIGFTIDFSGSMQTEEENKSGGTSDQKGKRKLEIALEEFQKTVQALKPEVRLNLVVMSTEAVVQKLRAWAKKLTPADARSKAAVVAWSREADKNLRDIKRGRGDMWDAMAELYGDEEVDTIFILSDGRPSYGVCIDERHFLGELRRLNRYRKVMLHTVLTGTKGTDRKFMEDLADETGGQSVAR